MPKIRKSLLILVPAAIMQPQASLVCQVVIRSGFNVLYLSLIAAFKQRPAVLLYHCFTMAKLCSAFAVHEMWGSLLERLTSTNLQTLKCCAAIKVNCCSAAAALRRSYGRALYNDFLYTSQVGKVSFYCNKLFWSNMCQ